MVEVVEVVEMVKVEVVEVEVVEVEAEVEVVEVARIKSARVSVHVGTYVQGQHVLPLAESVRNLILQRQVSGV